jgi:hypothetical protein
MASVKINFCERPFAKSPCVSADKDVQGEYGGDGKMDTTVHRPANSACSELRRPSGVFIITIGAAGDVPVPNSFGIDYGKRKP